MQNDQSTTSPPTFDINGALAAGYSKSDIANEIGDRLGFDVAAAHRAGHSNDDILSEMGTRLSRPYDPSAGGASGSSFSADIQSGLHNAGTTLGNAAQGIGSVLHSAGADTVGNYATEAGSWLKNHSPAAPANYEDRGGEIVSDLGKGNYARAAGDLAHGAVQAIPTMGAAIGAGALADTVGIPAAAGAAAVGGVMGLGAGAGERAEAAGRDAPSTSDVVQSLPRAASDAALNAVGFGKLPGSVLKRALVAAGSQGAQSGVDQADNSVAQGNPISIDPSQVGNAAILGGAMSGASEVPGAAKAGLKAGSDQLMSRTLTPPSSPEAAQSVIRINQMLDAKHQDAMNATGSALPDTAAANSVKEDLRNSATAFINRARQSGADPTDLVTLRGLVSNQALRHNNTINDDLTSLDSMDLGDMPKNSVDQFKNDVRDLNTVSTQSFQNATVGPFQALGRLTGQYGGAAAETVHNPMASLALLGLGHSGLGKIAGNAGAAVGASADRLLGTNTPTVRLQLMNAQRLLKGAGIDPATITTARTPLPAPPGPTVTVGPPEVPDDAAKATQMSAMQAQKAKQDALAAKAQATKDGQIDEAWNQNSGPNVPSADDYLNGNLNDASLYRPAQPLTTAQEIAINNQRLANQRSQAKTQDQQGQLFDQAANGGIDAQAQLALDKATRRNALKLAQTALSPSARPDVPQEAGDAAQLDAQRAANTILAKAGAGQPDPDTGLPPSDVPPNTPIPAGRPTPQAQPQQSTFQPTTPAEALATRRDDDQLANPAQAQQLSGLTRATQALQQAPTPRPLTDPGGSPRQPRVGASGGLR